MRAFTYRIDIERPPQAVWDVMMDRRNAVRWNNLVRTVEVVTPGPVRVGTELLVTFEVNGKTVQVTSEVWLVDPPRRYGVRNTRHNVTGVFEYQLDPAGTGTTVQFSGDVRPHGWMWLVLPILVKNTRLRYRDQLANLKRIVEERPSC